MTVQMADPISLTAFAKEKIEKLGGEKLRVYVEGGGCSGFSYGFSFETEIADDDTVIQNSIVIDPLSYQYIVGSVIDYTEGLTGSRFIVNNPLAVTTCGCGESFSI